jgi:hypothetical protein
MNRWVCTDGKDDSWAYVDDRAPDVLLILVWKNTDKNWQYQIVGTPLIGLRVRRGDTMAAAERFYKNMLIKGTR